MRRLGAPASALLNVTFSQVGWFACVLGAAGGWGEFGAALALLLVAVHLGLAESRDREWPLVLVAAGVGLIVDSLHGAFGVLDFREHAAGSLAPLWIVALWAQFATVLHFSMRWLSRRYVLAAAFGAIGGPLAFLGGERLGAATFGEPRATSLAVLALSWGVALPLLVRVADRLGGSGRYRLPGDGPTLVKSRRSRPSELAVVKVRVSDEGSYRSLSRP